jgi:hypothetical protein
VRIDVQWPVICSKAIATSIFNSHFSTLKSHLTANQQQKKKKKKCLHAVKHPQMPVLRAILWRGKKKKKVHLPPIVIQTPKFDTCSAVSFESTSIANRERTKKPKKPQKKNVWGETPSNAGITGNFVEGKKKKK